MGNADEGSISVTDLLRNLSAECGRLARIAQRLDEVMGELVASDQRLASALPAGIQDVDLLRQSLHALEQITASAAQEVPQQTNLHLRKAALAAGATLEKVREACLNRQVGLQVVQRERFLETSNLDAPALFDEF